MRRRLKSPPHSESRASFRVTSYFSRYMSFTVSRSICNNVTLPSPQTHLVHNRFSELMSFHFGGNKLVIHRSVRLDWLCSYTQTLASERPTMRRMSVSSSVPAPFIAALRRRAKYSCGFLAHLTIKQTHRGRLCHERN